MKNLFRRCKKSSATVNTGCPAGRSPIRKLYSLLSKNLKAGCGLLFFLIFLGCDYHSPVISEVQYRLNLINDLSSQKIYQKLSVYIMVQDQDGFEDLAKLYIIHDQTELFWTVASTDWQKNKAASRSFIGSNSLVMPNLADFPDGEYRVLLEDLAGYTTERSFFLYTSRRNLTLSGKANFPVSYKKGQKIFINSQQDKVSLWLFKNEVALAAGETDNLLSALQIKHGERGVSYPALKAKAPALPPEFTYFVYAYDNSLNMGLITGPYYFSDNF